MIALPSRAAVLGAGVTLGAAALALVAGAEPLGWLVRLGSIAALPPDASVRAFAGVLGAAGLGALLIPRWSRRLARVGCAVAAFAAIATASALLRAPDLTLAAALVVAAVTGWLWLALAPTEAGDPPSRVSGAWRILASIAVATAALAIAAASPVRQPRERGPLIETSAYESGSVIDLHVSRWEGEPLAATGIYQYLPELESIVASASDDVVYLVFYNVRCGHCHAFFNEHFAKDSLPGVRVVAIEIPEPPDAHTLETDQPESIHCPTCVRLTLGAGPTWMLSPPTVVRVERGIVTCANEPPGRNVCVP
jgi:multisubunit Na+/H+ antiporter MnhB subunit